MTPWPKVDKVFAQPWPHGRDLLPAALPYFARQPWLPVRTLRSVAVVAELRVYDDASADTFWLELLDFTGADGERERAAWVGEYLIRRPEGAPEWYERTVPETTEHVAFQVDHDPGPQVDLFVDALPGDGFTSVFAPLLDHDLTPASDGAGRVWEVLAGFETEVAGDPGTRLRRWSRGTARAFGLDFEHPGFDAASRSWRAGPWRLRWHDRPEVRRVGEWPHVLALRPDVEAALWMEVGPEAHLLVTLDRTGEV